MALEDPREDHVAHRERRIERLCRPGCSRRAASCRRPRGSCPAVGWRCAGSAACRAPGGRPERLVLRAGRSAGARADTRVIIAPARPRRAAPLQLPDAVADVVQVDHRRCPLSRARIPAAEVGEPVVVRPEDRGHRARRRPPGSRTGPARGTAPRRPPRRAACRRGADRGRSRPDGRPRSAPARRWSRGLEPRAGVRDEPDARDDLVAPRPRAGRRRRSAASGAPDRGTRASMRVVHRSGGSKHVRVGRENQRGDHRRVLSSSQRGQHLAREDLQAARLQLRRGMRPPGFSSATMPSRPSSVAQLGQPLDHAGGGAEHDLPREDVVVGEARHALGLHPAAVGGAGAGAAARRPGPARSGARRTAPGSRAAPPRRPPPSSRRRPGCAGRRCGSPRWPGLAPGLPVGRELRLQVGDLGGAEPDEDRQPQPAGGGNVSSLVVAMRMGGCGTWIRPRHDRGVLDPIELSLVAERLALPGLPDDLQRLAEAGLALGVGHPVDVVRPHDAAAPDRRTRSGPR